MFNNLRKTIANFIAPSSINVIATQEQLAKARSVTSTILPPNHHVMTQGDRSFKQGQVAGKISVSDMDNLNSLYLRDSIVSYAAWCALAACFSEYERVTGRKNYSDAKLNTLLDEFHCWNSTLPETKQMDEQAIAEATEKLCQPRPQQGNTDTDTIIARVKGCSVEELRKDRQSRAEQQAAKRQALMDGFLGTVWSFTAGDLNPSISGAKAEAKALQTMEFIANNWSGDPANIAAELLLIEDDLKYLKKVAHMETLREGEGYEERAA